MLVLNVLNRVVDVSDLAETMQSLQTIAEQYLPESWENDNQICPINAEDTSNNFNLIDNIYKCQFCGDSFKGKTQNNYRWCHYSRIPICRLLVLR